MTAFAFDEELGGTFAMDAALEDRLEAESDSPST